MDREDGGKSATGAGTRARMQGVDDGGRNRRAGSRGGRGQATGATSTFTRRVDFFDFVKITPRTGETSP